MATPSLLPLEVIRILLDPPPREIVAEKSGDMAGSTHPLPRRTIPTPRPRLTVTIADKRVVSGVMTCLDHLCNIIMVDVVETGVNGRRRTLNQVMVPGKGIVKVEVDKDQFDEICGRSVS